jgi:hypothetical protein
MIPGVGSEKLVGCRCPQVVVDRLRAELDRLPADDAKAGYPRPVG